MSGQIVVELTEDEALVLFDYLVRTNKSEQRESVDQAEQRALWNLEAVLEKTLVAPFDPKYSELVAAARERLRDPT
jgi:hypothetical protein